MTRLDARLVRREIDDGGPRWLVAQLGLDRGYRPKLQAADGITIRCPAHEDRSPSCSITRATDGAIRVRCFSCDFSGDAFVLVAAARGLDPRGQFAAVVREAAELTTFRGGDASSTVGACRVIASAPPLSVDLDAIAAPLLWAGRLDASPGVAEVTSYLTARGILERAQEHGWAGLTSARHQRATAKLLTDVFGVLVTPRGCGLVKDTGDLVFPDHRLLIPWRDAAGRVVALQRRLLGAGEPKYVFTRGGSPSLPYGVERIAAAPSSWPVVFVEGAVDVLALERLYQLHRVDRVVLGVPGVRGWRRDWGQFAAGREAVVAMDADRAGESVVAALAADLRAAGAENVRREKPRAANDWAEVLAQEIGGDS